MEVCPRSCSLLLWNHHILVFCRTLGAADDSVVASLLLICMIKICQQIAPEGVSEGGRACSSEAWVTPAGALGQTSSSHDWGFSWPGALRWVCHCAAATGWRTQQCLAWPRHSTWSPQRAGLQECHNQSLTLQCPLSCSWRALELLSFNILLLAHLELNFNLRTWQTEQFAKSCITQGWSESLTAKSCSSVCHSCLLSHWDTGFLQLWF